MIALLGFQSPASLYCKLQSRQSTGATSESCIQFLEEGEWVGVSSKTKMVDYMPSAFVKKNERPSTVFIAAMYDATKELSE